MPIDADLLLLTQWLSPAFPTGAFAFSHGLEAAVAEGWVTDEDSLADWLRDVLELGTGRCDVILLGNAWRAGPGGWQAIDAEARAFAAALERRVEAARQGAAFVATTNAVWALDLPDLTLPVAVGAAAGQRGLAPDLTAALYLQAMACNLTQVAQRLMPLGQTGGQRVLAGLTPVCLDIARAVDAPLDALSSAAFLSDIAAMRHETQSPRIFAT